MMNGKRQAHYMLRRNLALWKPERTITETIAFCLETGVREIIWKVDAEEFNHGFTPHELVQEYLKGLRYAKEKQAEVEIVFSVNPWLTQNHMGRARYLDGTPDGYWWRVHADGKAEPEMVCPLSAKWRRWLVEIYRLFATTRPDKLWIEDDFKTFIHSGYILGCYCDAHIKVFGEHVGEHLTRDKLVTRITAAGAPDPIRAAWIDFCGGIMVDICRELERVVHAESPTTRLGQMCSWSTDGRWWEASMQALAGPLRPLARTSLAPYAEGRVLEFLPDNFDILKEQACLPTDTENCPELENSLYTAYSKSAAMTRLQIILSQVLGNASVTMNLFDMVGSPTLEEPRYGRMLRDLKPFVDGLAAVAGPGGTPHGVSIPFNKRYADSARVPRGNGMDFFRFDGDGWAHSLQGSGVPVFLNGESTVSAVTGQSVRSMDRAEIMKLLAGGLLLDGSAASVLQELGYGEHLGIEIGERIRRHGILISAERDDQAENSDPKDPAYISVRHIAATPEDHLYRIAAGERGMIASTFVDPDHHAVQPGLVLFENGLGGRTAVYPFDLSRGTGAGFMSWRRRRQMQRTIRWLGRGQVALFVDGGAWMVPLRRNYPGHTLIAVLNLETDPWNELLLTFAPRTAGEPTFELLQHDGCFRKIKPAAFANDGPNVRVNFRLSVAALDCVVFRVEQKDEARRMT